MAAILPNTPLSFKLFSLWTSLAVALASGVTVSACDLELQVACSSGSDAISCSSINAPTPWRCTERPEQLALLYTGGACGESTTHQPDSLFYCEDDSNDGPGQHDTTYIVVSGLESQTVYHSDWVTLGSTFVVEDPGQQLDSNLLMAIYESEGIDDPNSLLQSVQFHVSGNALLFLHDRFGAAQVMGWMAEPSSAIAADEKTFQVTITPQQQQSGSDTSDLDSLALVVAGGGIEVQEFELVNHVNEDFLSEGDPLSITISVPLDTDTATTFGMAFHVSAIGSNESCQTSLSLEANF